MPWVRVDDGFSEHPKWGNATAFEIQWFIFALCYCNRNLTDGFVPAGVAERLTPTDETLPAQALPFRIIESLEKSGIIALGDKKGRAGYFIHDYLKYQPSRREVKRAQKLAKARKTAYDARHKNGNGTHAER